jgi:hypothetical protein
LSFIVINNPAHLPWQTNLFDVLMLTMFLSVAVYSGVQFRRGRRIYAVLLTAAIVYGVVLELAGVATLNMYVQGNFLVMINWTAIPLWKGTTMMPFYVVMFYPVILLTGFKVVEALGIRKRWQAAATGGLFMIALDAPYVIEGNLRHVAWWTWDPNFKLFQYWVGWPLADMCWQGLRDALFLCIMLWAAPRIDARIDAPAPWSNARAFGVFAPLVAAYAAIAAGSLRTARPAGRIERFTGAPVGLYVSSFTAMAIANVAFERGLTQHIVVQAAGLMLMSGLTLVPAITRRRHAFATPSNQLANAGHSAA